MSTYGAKELAASFRTVRGNTIQVAKDIPEEKYDFVAAPGTKTVRQMLTHIAFIPMLYDDMHRDRRITTLQGYDFGALMGHIGAREAEQPASKEAIVEALQAEGDRFAGWMASLSPDFLAETFTDPAGANPKTRLEHLMGAKEHEMHHRAQLMLIERMVGVVPHLTRQREDRTRQRAATARA